MVLKDYNPRDLFKDRMDILQLFYDTNKAINPDIVFVTNSKDIHQSHQVAYQEARRAFKYSTILGYELPWNSMSFDMDVFIEISEEDIKAKQASINSFETQKQRMFFSNDIVTDLAKLRGKQIGKEYAECFELTRMII
jgi:LmbE family N-acetylglucosaminyl deacetylase